MRTVPVLLSAELLECIEIILKYRHDACVPAKNIYLFGIPGYNKSYFKYLDACELMRRFSTECGAERPWTLRATDLRKHIATISVALDLSENDVSDLAKHMGHAMAIHKEIYRQPIVSRDIVRMSQVLEKAQGVTDNSDEYHINDNCEYLVENDASVSYEIIDSELSISNSTDNTSPNIENTYNAKKQNNQRNRKRKDTSPSEESDYIESHRSAKKRNTPPYGRTKRVRWTNEEKQIINLHFGNYIKSGKLPSIKGIQEVIAKNPCLQNRSASVVKTWINNQQRNNGLKKS
ncbi:uncharacterized protein LOC113004523 isoform X1 [Solenopsis invicta]|uniref:uncharacterized protein LOC113004523 isoform X1 n=1 Tax=Solenopsis invicta TaxID=13686 RepID=UPI00193DDFFD|nr:uncharacterized protein LOC113004523 isoform X1 [Solenopsis invicta]